MTKGRSGLHIWYPVQRVKTFDQHRDAIKKIALELEELYPEILTTEIRKEHRGSRIYIDCIRNAYGQTSVCPFSLRANSSAGVTTSIRWSELNSINSSGHYNFKYIFERLTNTDN